MERRDPVRVGAVALLVASLLLAFAYTGRVPLLSSDADGTLVRAELAATNELREGAPVRVGGADVGEVADIRLSSSGHTAVVEMRVTGDDVDVRRDARAAVRWRTVLGGSMYMELEPGSRSAAPLGEHTIPVSRTSAQVEFDDLNAALGGRAGQGQRDMVREFRIGLDRPDQVGRAIETAGDQLGAVDRGLRPYQGERPGDLRELVQGTAATLHALASGDSDLRRLVEGARETLGTTAARRADIGKLVRVAPPAMDRTVTTLTRLEATLDHADPLLARLRTAAPRVAPAGEAARPALHHLDVLLRESRPLLQSLRVSLSSLAGTRENGERVIRGLRPSLQRLDDVIVPMLARRDPVTGRRTYEMIGPTAAGASGAAGEFDDEGYWLRFPALGDERSLGSSPCQTFFSDPSRIEKIRCDSLADLLDEIQEVQP